MMFPNILRKDQEESDFQKIQRFRKALEEAEAVIIGAGAGLSTSAGFSYTGERFQRYFSDFAQKYGFHDMYSGGFYPYETLEEHWAYWSRYIYLNRYMDPPKPVYENLLELVKEKDYFVLTTNVDHCFQKAGFEKERLFYTQGDYGLFQCSEPCCQETWDNEENSPVEGHGEDQITITAAVNYDCGYAKSYLGVHWFDNAKAVGASSTSSAWARMFSDKDFRYGDATGWSVMAGVDVPVGGGLVKTSLGYLDASSDAYNHASNREVDKDFSRFMAAAGYEYYLSKRTTLYAGAGYIQDSVANSDPRWVQVNCGLTHKF